MGLTRKQAEALGLGHLYPKRTRTRKPPGGVAVPRPASPLREALPGESGPWTIKVPGWLPANLNRYLWRHWAEVSRAKKATAETILAACLEQRVPRATAKRRVKLLLWLPPGRRPPDGDNLLKSLLDGLVRCGALVDDGPDWCEVGEYSPQEGRLATWIFLDDITS